MRNFPFVWRNIISSLILLNKEILLFNIYLNLLILKYIPKPCFCPPKLVKSLVGHAPINRSILPSLSI